MKSKGRILVVDDDPVVVETLSSALTIAGYSVTGFASGAEVVAYCQAGNSHDLILMDYNMPEENGLETIKKIKSFSEAYFILITTYESEELVIEATNEGALTFVRKSMSMKELLPQIYVAMIRAKHIQHLNADYLRNRDINYMVGMYAEKYAMPTAEAFNNVRMEARRSRKKLQQFAEEYVVEHHRQLAGSKKKKANIN